MADRQERVAATEPQVGEKWMTPDGIVWHVWNVGSGKAHLRTEREYGTMTATCSKERLAKEGRRVSDH